jgi:NAD(P)-dependent dehydrogenase (short-subunit alcohol dehydrogenase family)
MPPVGNGRAMSVLFAREGAAVACADLDLAGAEETAAWARREGGRAHALQADVSKLAEIERLVQDALRVLGGLDGLDNRKPLNDLALFIPVEAQSSEDCRATEFVTQLVHRMLGCGGARCTSVDQIRRIRSFGADELGYGYSDQAILRAIGLAGQQVSAGGEDAQRKLRRITEPAGTRPEAKIRSLELERHRRSGQMGGLQPGRNLFAELP